MFIAHVNQTNYGCDYTIACGEALFELESTTYEEAVAELKCKFFDYPDQSEECEDEGYYSEGEMEGITLYKVSDKIILPISDWYDEERQMKKEIRLRQEQEVELAEYKRLKEKHGL